MERKCSPLKEQLVRSLLQTYDARNLSSLIQSSLCARIDLSHFDLWLPFLARLSVCDMQIRILVHWPKHITNSSVEEYRGQLYDKYRYPGVFVIECGRKQVHYNAGHVDVTDHEHVERSKQLQFS